MQNRPDAYTSSRLPVARDLTMAYVLSLIVALLVAVASVGGIVYQTTLYPAEQLVDQVGNDALNLVIGLPFLLGSMWFARRGSLLGLLFWPAALLYLLYVYVIYLTGVPFNALFLVYAILVTLCAYAIIGLVASIDGAAVRRRFEGVVPARWIGGLLVVFAVLFGAYQVSEIISAIFNSTTVDQLLLATGIGDLTVECPALLVAGILLWQRKPLGYVAGAGLLLQIGLLFVGLPIAGILGGPLTGTAANTSLVAFGAIGLLPLALLIPYVRGARSGGVTRRPDQRAFAQ
ncbi:MAG: hypothetical protein KJ065_12090 [Anaerolineae bacterium]|nr:hypothetical protein [Anaerolineae bacterium]